MDSAAARQQELSDCSQLFARTTRLTLASQLHYNFVLKEESNTSPFTLFLCLPFFVTRLFSIVTTFITHKTQL